MVWLFGWGKSDAAKKMRKVHHIFTRPMAMAAVKKAGIQQAKDTAGAQQLLTQAMSAVKTMDLSGCPEAFRAEIGYAIRHGEAMLKAENLLAIRNNFMALNGSLQYLIRLANEEGACLPGGALDEKTVEFVSWVGDLPVRMTIEYDTEKNAEDARTARDSYRALVSDTDDLVGEIAELRPPEAAAKLRERAGILEKENGAKPLPADWGKVAGQLIAALETAATGFVENGDRPAAAAQLYDCMYELRDLAFKKYGCAVLQPPKNDPRREEIADVGTAMLLAVDIATQSLPKLEGTDVASELDKALTAARAIDASRCPLDVRAAIKALLEQVEQSAEAARREDRAALESLSGRVAFARQQVLSAMTFHNTAPKVLATTISADEARRRIATGELSAFPPGSRPTPA